MDTSLISNLIDASVLFFFLGLLAGLIGSNMEVPQPIPKFLSLYLLMAIGFKGGVSLSQSGVSETMVLAILAALLLALIIPAYSYAILRRRVAPYDAAAIAATYGSVSAVTFIAANAFLTSQDVGFGSHMTVALVLMESPAIIMAVFLCNLVRSREVVTQARPVGAAVTPRGATGAQQLTMGHILKEAFTDGAQLLLLGSMAIGALTGAVGEAKLKPFTGAIFPGILAFFLLDMGLLVARRLKEAGRIDPFLIGFGLVMPPVNAATATALAALFGLPLGDTVLLTVLAASASYIVVPAVVRHAIPEADPSIYFTLSLAVTFPFNITIGIPLYFNVVKSLWGQG